MYFQFLIEDQSTNILVNHVMEKLADQYTEKEIIWNIKYFGGIGHLRKKGSVLEQKTGKLLNDLPMYMKAFGKVLQNMNYAALIIVLDNDKRDVEQFREELENVAVSNMILCDYVFCIAVKAGGSYSEIGRAKCEWADKIGAYLHLHENVSSSYRFFIDELEKRVFA